MRDAVREDAERHPSDEILVAARRVAKPQFAIIGRRRPDINPSSTAGETRGRNASILKRMPRQFEQQTLLRVHLRRLAR